MAVKNHLGFFEDGDIVGSKSSYSDRFYGVKLLKYVHVSEVNEYRWIAQPGHGLNDKWTPTGSSLSLLTDKEVKASYPELWTPGPSYKKGDILVGEENDRRMLFVFFSEDHVERLTPREDVGLDGFGYSTLEDYRRNFGPLEIHTVQGYHGNRGGKKFSEV